MNSLYDMSDAVDLLPAASGAADVAAKITALGTVTDCKRETYLALQEIEAAYAGLTAEEQAEVTNYGTFLQQKQTFQTLLEAYRKAKLAELDAYYDKLKRTDYTTSGRRSPRPIAPAAAPSAAPSTPSRLTLRSNRPRQTSTPT